MAKVYVARPTANWDDPNASDYLAKTIYEADSQAKDSGLLDAGGNKLFSIERRDAVGFIRFGDGGTKG